MTRTQSIHELIERFVDEHTQQNHDARRTVVAAPGSGFGCYCFTCKQYGPTNARILTIEDVR